ncbi:hypothetical protein ACN24L_37245 [Streptomyces microflavus]
MGQPRRSGELGAVRVERDPYTGRGGRERQGGRGMARVQQEQRPGAVSVVRDGSGGGDGENDHGSRRSIGGGRAARVDAVGVRVIGVPSGRQRAARAEEQVSPHGVEGARRGDGPQPARRPMGYGERQPQGTFQVHRPSTHGPAPVQGERRAAPGEGMLRQVRGGARHAG